MVEEYLIFTIILHLVDLARDEGRREEAVQLSLNALIIWGRQPSHTTDHTWYTLVILLLVVVVLSSTYNNNNNNDR